MKSRLPQVGYVARMRRLIKIYAKNFITKSLRQIWESNKQAGYYSKKIHVGRIDCQDAKCNKPTPATGS
jgi:hypothetical protein